MDSNEVVTGVISVSLLCEPYDFARWDEGVCLAIWGKWSQKTKEIIAFSPLFSERKSVWMRNCLVHSGLWKHGKTHVFRPKCCCVL